MDRQSTTFILMKILRDLNLNTNTEVREQQLRFFQDRFQRSNTNIERCIKSSTTDLTELIANFSDLYTSIQQSKIRVENIRECLQECKNLLLLKRQDIRKLWLSTSEQNALDRIYLNIYELKLVPSRLEFYLSKRLYIHASLLLLKAKEYQELRLINALSHIDLQIKEERVTLADQLRFELIYQLFAKPSRDILGNKNLSSTLNKSDQNSVTPSRENRLLRKQLDQEFEQGKLSFESQSLAIIPDKYMLVDIRNQTSNIYLDVLLQSLSILSDLNETIDFIQKQFHEQLYLIVLRTTQHIIDNNTILSNNLNQRLIFNNTDCLRDLLETVYEQFKLVVKNTEYLISILKLLQDHQAPTQIQQQEYLTRQKQNDCKSEEYTTVPSEIQFEIPYIFSIDFVWETLQQVLSDVLFEYVDYNNTLDTLSFNSSSTLNSTDYTNHSSLIDFSQYLMKKPIPPRSQQIPRLFEFSHSAQFHSMKSYLHEQNRFIIKQEASKTQQSTIAYKQYVCKPNYRNITAVHDVIQRIIEDIDINYKLHPTKRILDRKLTEFIRDRFIGRVIKDIRESAQIVSSSTATITDRNRSVELIPSVLQKQLKLSVPILQSTYLIFKSCEELCALVKCLPPYADDFCQAIVDLLFKHRESCYKLFLSIVEKNDSNGISIYSNEWVKDPDINRHLRTMPAFDAFIRMATEQHSTNNDNDNENVENIRFRQAKETETLLINFSQNEMSVDDICTNYKHIEVLATIHESVDWLYCKLIYYFDVLDKCLNDTKYLDALTQTAAPFGFTTRSIKQNSSHYDQLKLSRINLEIFSNAMKTTLTLSYDILLVLFLEIRLHCFYHLSLFFRNTSHYAYVIDTDHDENIMSLNRDLTHLQETLSSSLNEKKFSFLFQGLGFVLATILIRSSPRFNRINTLGVTKMCRNIFSIEQTLTQIQTVGDAELMRAHRYYESLYAIKPEEILNTIAEHGLEYSEQDYLNLLQLQYRSLSVNEREHFDLSQYEQLVKEALHPQIMTSITGESSLNLEKDVERAIALIDRLRTTSEIPAEKLSELQRILQSDFFHAVLEIYEKIYETVQITGSPEVRANATAKATVAAFAASEGHSHPRVIELPKTAEGLGFNVMGGREQNSPIYISRIIPNGVAWKHGGLKKGDQLLSVNGVSVENEYHEKAVDLLKQAQGTVKLVVRYSPQVLIEMENRFEQQRAPRKPATSPINK
ncbi:unnamed protein product [Rotaria socialis]|uniref:Exocyst complex component Sec8 n=1 Tax=Rotaria socialis TaxID=392032 RepID=A0A820H9T9_9BILA|nr:unnamed protein product [Rotaria socialis]CAF4289607.1 unnamed protein product [Rotaria socialis]